MTIKASKSLSDIEHSIISLRSLYEEISETRQRIRRHWKKKPMTNYMELELQKANKHLLEAGKHTQDYIESLQYEIERIETAAE